MDKAVINVDGMSDIHSQDAIASAITKLSGISDVRMNANDNSVIVEYDSAKVTNKDIKEAIYKTGYSIIEEKSEYKK